MDLNKDLEKALEELRKEKERKFNQTVDLVINLQKFNLKKSQINILVSIPFKFKDKKILKGKIKCRKCDKKAFRPLRKKQ